MTLLRQMKLQKKNCISTISIKFELINYSSSCVCVWSREHFLPAFIHLLNAEREWKKQKKQTESLIYDDARGLMIGQYNVIST